MAANLQSYKVTKGEGNDHTPTNDFVNAVQNSLNALGGSLNSWASGLVFDPAKIQQTGAASGDWLAWDGAKWDNATPAATTAVVISDSTLSADSSSFDFTSISGSYKHLRVFGYLRSDRSSGEDDIGVRFNADSASNYDGYVYRMRGTGPTEDSSENLAASSIKQANSVAGDTAPTNAFSTFEMWIPHYAGSTNNKILMGVYSVVKARTTGNLVALRGVGAWRSNSAITRVTLLPVGGGTNWQSGSRVVLYGLS